jgi:hypothetical protein
MSVGLINNLKAQAIADPTLVTTEALTQAVGTRLDPKETKALAELKAVLEQHAPDSPVLNRVNTLLLPETQGGLTRGAVPVDVGDMAKWATGGAIVGGVAGGIWNFGLGTTPGIFAGAAGGAALGGWLKHKLGDPD